MSEREALFPFRVYWLCGLFVSGFCPRCKEWVPISVSYGDWSRKGASC